MATPTIPNGEEHFFPIIYSGNGQGQRVGKFVPFTNNGTIAKSCMFNDGDSGYLSRTPSGTGNRRTFTFSGWVKRGVFDTSNGNDLFNAGTNPGNNVDQLLFDSSNRIRFYSYGGSYLFQYITNRTFQDTSKWYHIVCAVDTTQSSASDRVKIYVDGDLITSFSTETDPALNGECFHFNNTSTHYIGANVGSQRFYDGYIAEYNFVDGTALGPDTFGVTDTSTGRWIPKALTGITYGSNGFRLQFGTSSALGDDTSGNTNDFSVTNLVAADQRNDTPTNNLPVMRPYDPSYSQVLYEGNLTTYTNGSNKGYAMCSTLRPKGSGKYYAEVRTSGNGGGGTLAFGCYTQEDLDGVTASGNVYVGHTGSNGCGSGFWYVHGGTKELRFGATTTSNPTVTVNGGDVIGIALDLDNDKISFYDNSGSLIGSTTFDSSKSACFAAMSNMSITFIWNFGDNGTFAGYETAGGNADGDGNGNFYHSVPTGFKMLRQDNMPEPAKGITGMSWVKNRDSSSWYHTIIDSSRGALKELYPNGNFNEATQANSLRKFLKGGYQCGEAGNWNNSGDSFVSWNWVANGGTTASNGNGSYSSTVQVNQTAGFSIVQFTPGSSAGTVGHGLSQAPEWIIMKDTSRSVLWLIYHKSVGADKYLQFTNAAPVSNSTVFSTEPTSTVFDPGTGYTSASSYGATVAYCWHSVDGFSKFGSYTGNNSTDGPFIYTGFKPAWIMVKRTDTTGSWAITDTTRDPFNPTDKGLVPDSTGAEGTGYTLDHLSNGFKLRLTGTAYNASGGTYIYMAFAEHPFVGDGTNPVTAR